MRSVMSTACREEASAADVSNRRLLCDELAAGARGEWQQMALKEEVAQHTIHLRKQLASDTSDERARSERLGRCPR